MKFNHEEISTVLTHLKIPHLVFITRSEDDEVETCTYVVRPELLMGLLSHKPKRLSKLINSRSVNSTIELYSLLIQFPRRPAEEPTFRLEMIPSDNGDEAFIVHIATNEIATESPLTDILDAAYSFDLWINGGYTDIQNAIDVMIKLCEINFPLDTNEYVERRIEVKDSANITKLN